MAIRAHFRYPYLTGTVSRHPLYFHFSETGNISCFPAIPVKDGKNGKNEYSKNEEEQNGITGSKKSQKNIYHTPWRQ